jgi:hypothetical protein
MPIIDYKQLFSDALAQRGDFPECYAFSLHKAGSTLMHKMIKEVCVAAHISAISIPDMMFREGVIEKEWGTDTRILNLVESGHIYIGFRKLPEILLGGQINLQRKKSVLLIRDPRDALVSQYFSFGGKYISHRLPTKNAKTILDAWQSTADLEIDEYVIRAAPGYLRNLIAYKDNLDFDNVLLRFYEHVYYNKLQFLMDIFGHFGFSIDHTILEEVAITNDIRPTQEDISKHIRKGEPGDHIVKLETETVRRLNDIFRDICLWYGLDLRE